MSGATTSTSRLTTFKMNLKTSHFTKGFLRNFHYGVGRNMRLSDAAKPPLSTLSQSAQLSFYNILSVNNGRLLGCDRSHTGMFMSGFKSKQGRSNMKDRDDEDSDDEDYDADDGDDEIQGRGIETKTYNNLESLRVDSLVKKVLGYNRKKIEKLFYANKLRLNGRVILKKSLNANEGDEIDVIKGFAEENPKFLTVGRIEVLSLKYDKENEKAMAKLRCSKNLIIENYPDGDEWA